MAFKALQFNIIHRTYLTPHRLNVIYHREDQSCARCLLEDADYDHMLWSCPMLGGFWAAVVDLVNAVLERALPCDPGACLLGLFPRPRSRKLGHRFVDLAFLLAKRKIALQWKVRETPLVTTWETDVTKWVRAEEQALLTEDRITKRRKPYAEPWGEIAKAWDTRHEMDGAPQRNNVSPH